MKNRVNVFTQAHISRYLSSTTRFYMRVCVRMNAGNHLAPF